MEGAAIERGEVIEMADGRCRVQSFTRPGITTPMIPVLPVQTDVDVQVGDHVYFFVFPDGHGAVLMTF